MKLGMIGESIVNLMFTYDRIALPQDNTTMARIDTLVREGLLTRDALHEYRRVSKIRTNEMTICDLLKLKSNIVKRQ